MARPRHETVSELRAQVGLLITTQMIYEYGKTRWNDTDRGNPYKWYKNLSQCHSLHYKSHMN
jgi:hypothetical protein